MIDWNIISVNILFIIGLNTATRFEYCYGPELTMEHCDRFGVDRHSRYVLWFIRYYSEKLVGPFWTKPICSCIPCMASVWGTAGYWITHPIASSNVPGWFIHVGVIAGIGTFADKYING